MKEYESIKVDGSFPEYGTKQLGDRLNDGWTIVDKTVTGERYILYLIEKEL